MQEKVQVQDLLSLGFQEVKNHWKLNAVSLNYKIYKKNVTSNNQTIQIEIFFNAKGDPIRLEITDIEGVLILYMVYPNCKRLTLSTLKAVVLSVAGFELTEYKKINDKIRSFK